MNNGVGSWDENRKLVFSELERLSECVSENTKDINSLTTRVAVIWFKISVLGAVAGVGGGAGTILGKALLDLAKH